MLELDDPTRRAPIRVDAGVPSTTARVDPLDPGRPPRPSADRGAAVWLAVWPKVAAIALALAHLAAGRVVRLAA